VNEHGIMGIVVFTSTADGKKSHRLRQKSNSWMSKRVQVLFVLRWYEAGWAKNCGSKC